MQKVTYQGRVIDYGIVEFQFLDLHSISRHIWEGERCIPWLELSLLGHMSHRMLSNVSIKTTFRPLQQ